MGLNPGHLDDAKKMVKGLTVHPMIGKSIEDEAIRLNDKLRHDVSLITNANEHAQDIMIQCGFKGYDDMSNSERAAYDSRQGIRSSDRERIAMLLA